jgi:hypothetical protein
VINDTSALGIVASMLSLRYNYIKLILFFAYLRIMLGSDKT